MNLTSYSECEKTLDFQPEKPWPSHWPPFAWENKLISGFTPNKSDPNSCDNHPILNFSSTDVSFLQLFHTCHPQLNLSELGRLILKWSDREKPICSWKEFLPLYGFHHNIEFLIQQFKVFISTPMSFQSWVNKKAVHLSELRILNSLEDVTQIHFIFEWMAKQSPSHSQGIKVLELGVELFLMNMEPDKVLKSNLPPEKAIQEMEKKRKPIAFSKEEIKKSNLKKITWPPHVIAEWKRKGDLTGLEIKIWSQNTIELEKKINKIKQLCLKI